MNTVRLSMIAALLCVPLQAHAQEEPEEEPPTESVEEVSEPEPPTETDKPIDEGRGSTGQGDRAAAESLARVGKGLMDLGRYDEACPKLAQSMEASATGETAMLLGACMEKRGKVATAWAAYRQAITHFKVSGDPQADAARRKMDALEPQVPKLTLLATERYPGMTVYRDETKFGVGVIGVPLALDPGHHTIRVEADGYKTWIQNVDIKASSRSSVTIPGLEVQTVTPDRAGAVVSHSSSTGAWFVAGVVTAGAGLIGLGVGGILGASASRDVHVAEASSSLCGQARQCTPAGRELIDRADVKATGATIAFIAGGVATLAGMTFIIIDSTTRGGTEVEAALAPGALSARIRF